MLVSSDINSANHNYPTNYNEAMYVAGAIPDTAPFGACDGTPSFPGFGDPTDFLGEAGEEFNSSSRRAARRSSPSFSRRAESLPRLSRRPPASFATRT